MMKNTARTSQVTVISNVYFQCPPHQPLLVSSSYSYKPTSDEQPYIREMTIGEEWQPLDCGWIERCSLLIIKNEEGRLKDKFPGEKEKEETAARVVEIAVFLWKEERDPERLALFSTISPGRDMRITPIALSDWRIRCRKGKAQVIISLIPE
jgi:hypothetical protein